MIWIWQDLDSTRRQVWRTPMKAFLGFKNIYFLNIVIMCMYVAVFECRCLFGLGEWVKLLLLIFSLAASCCGCLKKESIFWKIRWPALTVAVLSRGVLGIMRFRKILLIFLNILNTMYTWCRSYRGNLRRKLILK